MEAKIIKAKEDREQQRKKSLAEIILKLEGGSIFEIAAKIKADQEAEVKAAAEAKAAALAKKTARAKTIRKAK